MCVVCVVYPWRQEEGAGSHGSGVTGGCKPPKWVLGANFRYSVREASALNCEPSLQLLTILCVNLMESLNGELSK